MYFNILNSNTHSACFFFFFLKKGILHFHFLVSLKIISKKEPGFSFFMAPKLFTPFFLNE